MIPFNSLFATYKSPVCHIILERTGIGAPFLEILFSTHCIFLPVNRMENRKAKLIMHAHSANQKQWESLHRAIRMNNRRVYITVQIGERGNFTGVQMGEHGKQRVNARD